jgi:hypothetical protein
MGGGGGWLGEDAEGGLGGVVHGDSLLFEFFLTCDNNGAAEGEGRQEKGGGATPD